MYFVVVVCLIGATSNRKERGVTIFFFSISNIRTLACIPQAFIIQHKMMMIHEHDRCTVKVNKQNQECN